MNPGSWANRLLGVYYKDVAIATRVLKEVTAAHGIQWNRVQGVLEEEWGRRKEVKYI